MPKWMINGYDRTNFILRLWELAGKFKDEDPNFDYCEWYVLLRATVETARERILEVHGAEVLNRVDESLGESVLKTHRPVKGGFTPIKFSQN